MNRQSPAATASERLGQYRVLGSAGGRRQGREAGIAFPQVASLLLAERAIADFWGKWGQSIA